VDRAESLKNARQFTDTAYNAATEAIARDAEQKLRQMTASLAARGLVASGAMVSETARINAERYSSLLQARLDALLEGYELYGVEMDDQLVDGTIKEMIELRATMIAGAKNWSGGPGGIGLQFGGRELYGQLVDQSITVSANSIKTQIDRRRLHKKKSMNQLGSTDAPTTSKTDNPLTDTEREIAKAVVHRFLSEHRPTLKKPLIRGFKSPQSLEHLVTAGIISPFGNRDAFLPTALAFQYCGDAEALEKAKRSLTMVLRILHNLFEIEWEKEDFTCADVKQHANKLYDLPPSTEEIELGLYLVREFKVLQSYLSNSENGELQSFRMSDDIVTLRNIEDAWDEHVRSRSRYLFPESIPNAYEQAIKTESNSRSVFIVHGHDTAIKQTVARYLERLGLDAIILHEQPNKGATIVEKFEANSDVGFAVVLLTPDDVGGVAIEPRKLNPRARQNVVFELGYFIGKLGRERVCALHTGGVEIPSDFQGVVYIPYDDEEGSWRLKLAKELREAGMKIDLNRV